MGLCMYGYTYAAIFSLYVGVVVNWLVQTNDITTFPKASDKPPENAVNILIIMSIHSDHNWICGGGVSSV